MQRPVAVLVGEPKAIRAPRPVRDLCKLPPDSMPAKASPRHAPQERAQVLSPAPKRAEEYPWRSSAVAPALVRKPRDALRQLDLTEASRAGRGKRIRLDKDWPWASDALGKPHAMPQRHHELLRIIYIMELLRAGIVLIAAGLAATA